MAGISFVPGVNDRLRDRRRSERTAITEAHLRELTSITNETHLLKQSRRQKASMHVMTPERLESLLVRRGWNPMRLVSELYHYGHPVKISDIERWRRGETPGPDEKTVLVLRKLGGEAMSR